MSFASNHHDHFLMIGYISHYLKYSISLPPTGGHNNKHLFISLSILYPFLSSFILPLIPNDGCNDPSKLHHPNHSTYSLLPNIGDSDIE